MNTYIQPFFHRVLKYTQETSWMEQKQLLERVFACEGVSKAKID